MKKLALATAALLAVSVLPLASFASESGASLGTVPQSYADITVDAVKDDIYNYGLKLDISRPLTEGQEETGTHGTGWLLYKDGWLYEYAEIIDPQLFDPDPSKQTDTPWETESLELFVNATNSDESTEVMQYRIDVQGWPCVYDQNGLADYGPENVGDAFKYAEKAITGGYAVEFAVPVNAAEGAHIGFQNQINDRYDDDSAQVQWMTPSSLGSSSWTAELYDYIVIGKMLVPAAVGYDSAEAAAAAAGKNLITGYTFVEGSEVNFGEEYAENLWDADVETKYCTAEDCNGEEGFPAWSTAKLPAAYDITGFTMATANDNESYNGRSPLVWNLYVSADGSNWTTLASGDDTFFDELNYTYFVGDASASNVSYVKFECLETDSGTMQVSEVNLFGDIHVEAEVAPAPAAEAAPAAAPAAEVAPAAAPAPAAAAPAAAPVAEAAPAAPAAAAQTGDVTAIAVLAAVAALGTAVVVAKKH